MNLLTITQVAALLNVNKRTVFRMKHTEPTFPKPIVFSRRNIRYDRADIEAFISNIKRGVTA